jgi:hypothetical protein
LLCEPVEPPKGELEHIHYFCGNTEIPSDLEEPEPQRAALYKATAALVRAYANIADELEAVGYSEAEIASIKQHVQHSPAVCVRSVPMTPRSSWKGYLKLSLVSCPIALYLASSSSERVSFNRINKKTGTRLKQQLVDAETGETVEKEDIARGYEIGKGQYRQIEDEEIEKIRIERHCQLRAPENTALRYPGQLR